jgi:hypothetical protein
MTNSQSNRSTLSALAALAGKIAGNISGFIKFIKG